MKTAKWAVVAGFVIDGACLAGGYYFYYQMKNSSGWLEKSAYFTKN